MYELNPTEFWLVYAGLMLIALFLFVRRRPRNGMRLRLDGLLGTRNKIGGAGPATSTAAGLTGAPGAGEAERSLNVHFNYNGHSWDAYEVLGLPAGSSLEKVNSAYKEALVRFDQSSRPFAEAAFNAIQEQVKGRKAASEN